MKTEKKQKRRKARRKALSLLLAVMLAVTGISLPMSPVTVRAETLSGDCGAEGSNVTWDFNSSSKTLTISGTGEMKDYDKEQRPDWYTDWTIRAEATKIIIEEGVTNIGTYAFEEFSRLTEAEIPGSVTIIGKRAFSNCNRLETISVLEDVTSIGDFAFGYCSALKAISIPDGVTSIGDGAFEGCRSLSSIHVPDSVTEIGVDAFRSCSSLTGATLPSGLTTIEGGMFQDCSSLTGITIPSGVTMIGEQAFYYCGSLTSVTIPNSVTTIRMWAFAYCSNLTSVTLPSKLEDLRYGTFENCTELESVVVTGRTPAMIGSKAFVWCNLKKGKGITVPPCTLKRYQGEWREWAVYMKEAELTAAYVKSMIEDFLQDYAVTNATADADIQADLEAALSEEGIGDVQILVATEKTPATAAADGSVTGTVTITVNEETETASINKTIGRLTLDSQFEGAGTEDAPYQIRNKEDLEKLRDCVNGGMDLLGVHLKLTADIDLEGGSQNPWTPIGTEESPFKGTLDGDGHTVSGLFVDDAVKDNQGLFGVNAGTIENLTAEGSVTGKDNVGGIAGTNAADGTIKGCVSNADVSGANNVGGIAGKNDGTVADCESNGTVAGTASNAGGIAGTNTGTVSGSDNAGSVSGKDNAGGIAGKNDGAVTDCANSGSVTGTGSGTGGIAGTNDGSLNGDRNTAPVTGKDDVGGIAGTNGGNGTAEGCSNSGNVTGDGNGATGAIAGSNQNASPDAFQDDYYQKTDEVNKDLSGIGEGTGAGEDPEGIASGPTPERPDNPEKPFHGAGTKEDPYRIGSKEDLEKLRDLVNQGEYSEGDHFKLTADINLEGGPQNPWTPIGTGESPFRGTLDGGGHTVSGLHVDDAAKDNQGLFGVNAGTIENLAVEGSVTGKDNVGGIAGTNAADGTIKGCVSNVTVTGESNVGGIAGKNDRTVADCENNGTVTGTASNAGGIAGTNTGTVSGSDNAGSVIGKDNVGGIAGKNDGAVADCENNGTVTGTASNAGGIAGTNTGTVSGSDNAGSVIGKDNVGGIAGTNTGTVSGSDNAGSVSGENSVGGIAGNNGGTGSVENSANSGSVTGTGSGTGGIAGTNDGSLKNDKNTAPVTGRDDVGGIAGTNGASGTAEGCANSGNVTGDGNGATGAIIGNNQNANPDAFKDDYYQKTDEVNKDLSGIGEGAGAGTDPAGITSGQTPTSPEKTFEGSGTAEDPYKIGSREDLEKLRDLVNQGKYSEDDHFKLTEDIDLGGAENPWTPIGTEENPFKGTLDGGGHTVSGLHVDDATKDNQGLFGVNAGTIENLAVEGSVTGKDNVGGIAGTNTADGVIKDCVSNADVGGASNAGGIAGTNDGTVADCENNGTVAGTVSNAGGIAGTNTGTVSGSDNAGSVSGKDSVGGIAGNNGGSGGVENSANSGSVTGTGSGTGGIAGTNTGTVSGSDNAGSVSGEDSVGGVAGKNDGSLKNDLNTAPVTGRDDVGGIAGTNGGTGTAEGCGNSGNVTGDANGATGAIAGSNQNASPDAFKDDYYQKTDEVNKDLAGIGEGTGAGTDPAGITSGQAPTNPEKPSGTDQEAARAFENEKIAAIAQAAPAGGAAWKKAVRDAKEAFDRLTDSQKSLVSGNAKNILTDALAILAAVEKIEAVGTVANTPQSAGRIKAARDGYDALTIGQKGQFPASVLKRLEDAEKAYAALQGGNGGAGRPNLSPEQQEQVDDIAEKLGVSQETAEKIQAVAEELGIAPEVLLLTDKSFTGSGSESDVKGAEFTRLQARASKVTASKVTLKWKKLKGADGYLVYGTRCGKSKMKLLKTIKKSGQTSYTQSRLKKGKPYRYAVRAYKLVDGRKVTLSASKMVHVFTDGGKYGNAKAVKLKKSKAAIKKGKTFKIGAKEVRKKKPLKKHRQICYESSDKKVATVTKKGVVKGKAKGSCKIYVYDQSGICKTVKVTVK